MYSDHDKQTICWNFYASGDHSTETSYFQALIEVLPINKKRKKRFTFQHIVDKVLCVCREGFAGLHGIRTKRVRNVDAV